MARIIPGGCRACGAWTPPGEPQCDACDQAEYDARQRGHTDRRKAVYGRGGTWRDPYADNADLPEPVPQWPTPRKTDGSTVAALMICLALGAIALIVAHLS